MPSLTDIAKLVEKVEIRGVQVEVKGITAQGLALLFLRFEDLRKLFGGRADLIAPEKLMAQSPELIGAFIAAGLGKPNDGAEEAVARELAVGDQLPLLEAIWRVTFPRGVKDFMQALERVLANVPLDAFGKEQVTKSAEPSNASSNSATRPSAHGDTPQESSKVGSSSMNGTDTETKQSSLAS